MKAVLMSIQPKWCELIASGKKTVEVRKTKPNLDVPFKVYIYCTSGKPYWLFNERFESEEKANGKIIGEFVCNGLTYIEAGYDTNGNKHLYNTAFLEHRMCIPDNELHKYLYKSRENSGGWAWHITNLVIYDKLKELSKFHKPCRDIKNCLNKAFRESGHSLDKCFDCGCEITRPPQSWCYVERVN